MRRFSGAVALIVSFYSGAAVFATGDAREVPPPDYFVGKYEVVGRMPDSHSSYTGTLELKHANGAEFIMIRKIGGHETKGTAVLDHADPPADRPAVLRVRFLQDGMEFEGTFHWRSDFDNYPRLTGLIQPRSKNALGSAGLEAWFPNARLTR